jgi:hypothetical protein
LSQPFADKKQTVEMHNMHCAQYTNLKHSRKTIAIHDAKIRQNALVKNIDPKRRTTHDYITKNC